MAEVGAAGSAPDATQACPSKAEALAGVELPAEAGGCAAIVSFRDDLAPGHGIAVVERGGARFRFALDLVGAAAVTVPSMAALRALASDADVADIIPDRRVSILAPPAKCEPWPACKDGGGGDESAEVVPSGVKRIGADSVSYTGFGVGVAIVDTGIDLDHPDLYGNLAAACFAASGFASCEDDHGHGTHVAGIVAAEADGADVVGVAREATLYAVKVLDQTGSGTDSQVLSGLEWVWTTNDDALAVGDPLPIAVVNMSLGGAGACLGSLYDVYTTLLADQGVTVVAAAGNNRNKEISDFVPAGCPAVLAVASTSAEGGTNKCRFVPGELVPDMASYFTTDGAGVTVSAPGAWRESINRGCIIKFEGVLSDQLGGGTVRKAGTSMAAPHVAGTVALMHEAAGGALGAEQARCLIEDSAELPGTAPYQHVAAASDDGVREGILDAPAASAAAADPTHPCYQTS